MIKRLWHGWTTPEDADAYEQLLRGEIFPDVDESVEGYHGVEILRRSDNEEVEFLTMMRFDSLDSVAEFAGEEYEQAHVPPEARELLTRFDDHATHYEVRPEQEG